MHRIHRVVDAEDRAIESKRSILVVEDDDLTRELLVKVLRREGYGVAEAVDGLDALEKLGVSDIHLVLADIQMARLSGIELLDRMRKRAIDIPVVLVTGYGEPSAALDAVARGAADYLAKPVDVIALRAAVARALEHQPPKAVAVSRGQWLG